MLNSKLIISMATLLVVITSILLAKTYMFPTYKPEQVSAQTNISPSSTLKNLKIKETDLQLLNGSGSGVNKENINYKIKNIQDQLKFINIKNLPQPVQGILRQIMEIPKQPLSNIKNACIQICSKL